MTDAVGLTQLLITSRNVVQPVGGPDTYTVVRSRLPSVGYVSAPLTVITGSPSNSPMVLKVGPGDSMMNGLGRATAVRVRRPATAPATAVMRRRRRPAWARRVQALRSVASLRWGASAGGWSADGVTEPGTSDGDDGGCPVSDTSGHLFFTKTAPGRWVQRAAGRGVRPAARAALVFVHSRGSARGVWRGTQCPCAPRVNRWIHCGHGQGSPIRWWT
ncbi:hypothetical protein ACFFX0_07440 [Citricoccus parietis]|uniref:Uncharacterized protein n=1 Tax=Citricoccus parietis TaxID=592307 RepID=A0ABV5FWH6_9MICC